MRLFLKLSEIDQLVNNEAIEIIFYSVFHQRCRTVTNIGRHFHMQKLMEKMYLLKYVLVITKFSSSYVIFQIKDFS